MIDDGPSPVLRGGNRRSRLRRRHGEAIVCVLISAAMVWTLVARQSGDRLFPSCARHARADSLDAAVRSEQLFSAGAAHREDCREARDRRERPPTSTTARFGCFRCSGNCSHGTTQACGRLHTWPYRKKPVPTFSPSPRTEASPRGVRMHRGSTADPKP